MPVAVIWSLYPKVTVVAKEMHCKFHNIYSDDPVEDENDIVNTDIYLRIDLNRKESFKTDRNKRWK